MLRSAAVVPPRIVFVADQRRMPSPPFATALVPAAFVPVRLPRTTFAFGMALDAKPVKIEILVRVPRRVAAPAVTPPIVLFEPPSIAILRRVGDPAAPAAFVAGVVALNRVVARVQQEDAVAGVSGDDVARGGRRAADHVPGRAGDRPDSAVDPDAVSALPRSVAPSAADRSRSPGRRCSTSSARYRCWHCRTPRFRQQTVRRSAFRPPLRASGCRRGSESPRCRRGWSPPGCPGRRCCRTGRR